MKFLKGILLAMGIVTLGVGCAPNAQPPVEGALFSCRQYVVWPDSIFIDGNVRVPGSVRVPDQNRLMLMGDNSMICNVFNIVDSVDTRVDVNDIISRLKQLPSAPDSQIGMGFPIVMTDAGVVAEAIEAYRREPDLRLKSAINEIAPTIINRDRRYAFCDSLYLFKGIDDVSAASMTYPRWLNPMQLADAVSFRNNVNHAVILDFMARNMPADNDFGLMRDSLVNAIDTYLWIPDKGRFSSLMTGWPEPKAVDSTDFAAEAIYINSGLAAPALARSMAAHVAVDAKGVESQFPAGEYPAYSNVEWGVAASKAGDERLLASIVGVTTYDVYRGAAPVDDFRRLIIEGVMGVVAEADGVTFRPFVPAEFHGLLALRNYNIGNALLNVNINGTGNIISTFSIDGTVTDSYKLDADISGEHTIDITLVGTDRSVTEHGESVGEASAPLAAPASPALDDAITIDFTEVAKPYARSLSVSDRRLSHSFVESTRYRNKSLTFDVDVPAAGYYFIYISYINGEGIVNPDRRYATRLLTVNGGEQSLMVFSQLAPADWRHDSEWYASVGVTPPVRAYLNAGANSITLDYFAPDVAEFNHDSNTFIPLKIFIKP